MQQYTMFKVILKIEEFEQMFLPHVLSHFSHDQPSETLWTVAHQTPLSMGFSRRGHWSGLPGSPPGDLPDPYLLHPLHWQAGSLPLAPAGKPFYSYYTNILNTVFSYYLYIIYPNYGRKRWSFKLSTEIKHFISENFYFNKQ